MKTTTTPRPHSAFEVANYFLFIQDEEDGDLITNLKLQKLLYYAQGFSLAILNRPLFTEKIKAWALGPVVPQVWKIYEGYGNKPINKPDDSTEFNFATDEKELLDEIWKVFGQFSARALKDFTHQEPPWKNTPINGIITLESMKDYFKTRIK